MELTGICDTVELHADGTVLPVEHKSGRYHFGGPADVQVAAQAMCLEYMFKQPVTTAAIYSGTDRRRHTVTVNEALRTRVLDATNAVRNLLSHNHTLPPPVADSRCRRCSMATDCRPKLLAGTHRYQQALHDLYLMDDTQDDE
ncbi:Dna2/Cas4 domain-containing protein [Streptomyces pilosus]|uniref:CRISPR-associated protein Cas4 n=1 Tax=Streptomyces pilosus TaxID=28893 RepID=UPI0036F87855